MSLEGILMCADGSSCNRLRLSDIIYNSPADQRLSKSFLGWSRYCPVIILKIGMCICSLLSNYCNAAAWFASPLSLSVRTSVVLLTSML